MKRILNGLIISSLLFSCVDYPKNIMEDGRNKYDCIIKGRILYSQDTILKAEISGDTIYNNSDKGCFYFNAGVVLKSYDENKKTKAILTADSCVYFVETKHAEFFRNVIIIELKANDTLWSEELYVDIIKDSVYTNKNVHIKTDHENIFGSGFYSNIALTEKRILHPRGTVVTDK